MRSRARSARIAGVLPSSGARKITMSRLATVPFASGGLGSGAAAPPGGASAASNRARTTRQAIASGMGFFDVVGLGRPASARAAIHRVATRTERDQQREAADDRQVFQELN